MSETLNTGMKITEDLFLMKYFVFTYVWTSAYCSNITMISAKLDFH